MQQLEILIKTIEEVVNYQKEIAEINKKQSNIIKYMFTVSLIFLLICLYFIID